MRRAMFAAAILTLALGSVGRTNEFLEGDAPLVEDLGSSGAVVEGDRLAYVLWESFVGRDLNGDGDTGDGVLHLRTLPEGVPQNLRLAAAPFYNLLHDGNLSNDGNWLMFQATEDGQGMDFNRDGDIEDQVAHVVELATGDVINLELAGFPYAISGVRVLVNVWESGQGVDLNGDGDSEDNVVHVYNLSSGETTNLGLAGSGYFAVSGDWIVVFVSEGQKDLNDDGDTEDHVVHVHDLATGETTNLRLARWWWWWFFGPLTSIQHIVLPVGENHQGKDLNGDGDTEDNVVHVHDLSTGETTNLRLDAPQATKLLGGRIFMNVSESVQDEDLNGDATWTTRSSTSWMSRRARPRTSDS